MIVFQTNLNKRTAHELLEQTVVEWKVDVVLVSKSNKKLKENGTWITDEDMDVAIKVYNHTEEPRWTKSEKRRGIVWVDFREFKLCAVYISRSVKLEIYRQCIKRGLQHGVYYVECQVHR